MLPRYRRVGTIYTSAAEVRDRSRPAHGAFYSTISLPGLVYKTRVGTGLNLASLLEQVEYRPRRRIALPIPLNSSLADPRVRLSSERRDLGSANVNKL